MQIRDTRLRLGGRSHYHLRMETALDLAVIEILSTKRRILLTTHVRPDGDALGSTAAMALGLRRKGIDSQVLLFNPLPEKYAVAFKDNQIPAFDIEAGWPAGVDVQSFDALLVLDTGTWSQLPGLKELMAHFAGPKVVVDHHLTQEDWADLKLVDTKAAAAGEIVARLLKQWGVALDEPIAAALFWAIATDTGWFQYSNTTPATLRAAATLMDAGVDTDRIYRMAYQNERPEKLSLMGRALQSLELLADNRLAVMCVGEADFKAAGAGGSDTENLINIPMQVASVEVSVFLSQQPGKGGAGPVRASLRSKGAVDVAAFAQKFSPGNGGGHARAAGLKLEGSIEDARRAISSALAAELSR